MTSPFSLEQAPVINHLLIKPNDRNRNTFKQTIKLSSSGVPTTGGSMAVGSSMSSTAVNSDELVLDQNLVEKINHSKAMIDELLKDPNSTNKKQHKPSVQSKPYYSDDDEDDDDDDDLDEVNDDEEDDVIESPKSPKTKAANDEEEEANVNSMTLIDLANLSEQQQQTPNSIREKKETTINTPTSSLSTSSSTSPISSPMMTSNKSTAKTPNKTVVTTPSVTKSPSKTSTTATSIIINHLIDEEKRQKPPANPFPVKHLNSNIAKNGLRLGLYK